MHFQYLLNRCIQRCMCLPGGNFQGLEKKKRLTINSQTFFSFFFPLQAYLATDSESQANQFIFRKGNFLG